MILDLVYCEKGFAKMYVIKGRGNSAEPISLTIPQGKDPDFFLHIKGLGQT